MAEQIQSRKQTANEFTNVKDIEGIYLYSRDGYIFCYLRIPFFNIDLVPRAEKRAKAKALAAAFSADKFDFAYCSYPREIDLDVYKNDIKKRYRNEMDNRGRQKLLQIMLAEATELATNGENYEHQHFIKIWKKVGSNKEDDKQVMKSRIEDMKIRYNNIGVSATVLQEAEIVKMCNLYGNSLQAPYEVNQNQYVFETITTIK